MYAVIDLTGKQQKVEQDEVIRIDKLDKNIGDEVAFDKVILFKNENGDVNIGTPYLEDVKVTGKVLDQDREKKIIVFKKKRRKGYKKKQGHRQDYTAVQITNIELKSNISAKKAESAKTTTTRKKVVAEKTNDK
ncbi:MAG: 50S ribosomal protein L21 [bacterium]|nr:50S ribosomal protein L21 [bacterium]